MTGPKQRDKFIPATPLFPESDVPCPGCGYNLRGLRDRRCPECGRAFDRSAATLQTKDGSPGSPVIPIAFGLGLVLQIIVVMFMGAGHGTYLPAALVAGVTNFVPMIALIGGPVLFTFYGLILLITRLLNYRFAGLLTIFVLHYGSILVLFLFSGEFTISAISDEFQKMFSMNSVMAWVFVLIYLYANYLAIYFALHGSHRVMRQRG